MITVDNYYAFCHGEGRQSYGGDVWVIMRYAPKGMPASFTHVPELAPSWELFNLFKRLKETNNWNECTFSEQYAPAFLRQLATDSGGSATLQRLLSRAYVGADIALLCTCQKEELCHRSIVAGLLQGVTPTVNVQCGGDYSHYWREFNTM